MKIQIRNNVFETNSSSVHSLTMCSSSDYKKWVSGELWFDNRSDAFVSEEEAKKINESLDEADIFYNGAITYEKWLDGVVDFEIISKEFETKAGENVTVFGYYGYC